MEVKAAVNAQAAAERERRALAARRELEEDAVAAARLRKIRAQRVSLLKVRPIGALQSRLQCFTHGVSICLEAGHGPTSQDFEGRRESSRIVEFYPVSHTLHLCVIDLQ